MLTPLRPQGNSVQALEQLAVSLTKLAKKLKTIKPSAAPR